MKELIEIQSSLKAKKSQRNNFAKFNYRSCEDILEALKPLLKEHNCMLTISDEIVQVGDRIYVKATAEIEVVNSKKKDNEDYSMNSCGWAREPLTQKGMSDGQLTGATSSYARKYALCGLFLIDDSNDLDSMENRPEAPKKQAKKPAPMKVEDYSGPHEKMDKFFNELPDLPKPGMAIDAWDKWLTVNAPNYLDEFRMRSGEFLANRQQQGK